MALLQMTLLLLTVCQRYGSSIWFQTEGVARRGLGDTKAKEVSNILLPKKLKKLHAVKNVKKLCVANYFNIVETSF